MPDETEQKLTQMMSRAESVVAAYNERAARVIVNVLVTSDEVVSRLLLFFFLEGRGGGKQMGRKRRNEAYNSE